MGLLQEAAAAEKVAAVPLVEVARATVDEVTLAVARRADSTLILCREIERGIAGADGKRSRENGTEKVLKPTASLADIERGIRGELL